MALKNQEIETINSEIQNQILFGTHKGFVSVKPVEKWLMITPTCVVAGSAEKIFVRNVVRELECPQYGTDLRYLTGKQENTRKSLCKPMRGITSATDFTTIPRKWILLFWVHMRDHNFHSISPYYSLKIKEFPQYGSSSLR